MVLLSIRTEIDWNLGSQFASKESFGTDWFICYQQIMKKLHTYGNRRKGAEDQTWSSEELEQMCFVEQPALLWEFHEIHSFFKVVMEVPD